MAKIKGGYQPYAKKGGIRPPGMALDAMLRGRDFSGRNPADIQRGAQLIATSKKVLGRPRKTRVKRPTRPPR